MVKAVGQALAVFLQEQVVLELLTKDLLEVLVQQLYHMQVAVEVLAQLVLLPLVVQVRLVMVALE
jgi:hypothetical protein